MKVFQMDPRSLARPASARIAVRWEGPFRGYFSFSIINREICSRLLTDRRIELSILPNEPALTAGDCGPIDWGAFSALADCFDRPLSIPAQVHIQNHVAHHYRAPAEGRWVVIQPWDYVSLPVRWVKWVGAQLDEVWVPSNFVRSAYLDAGIHPERVAVVPNGVDTRLYRPEARKAKLNTRKSFKFLFVGGPFWRKGFDSLLHAYARAFTARDDVTLVVKSVPEFWTDAGTRLVAEFRSRPEAPEVVPVVRALDPLYMAGLYAACDSLVHPYRAEGFAMCVAEAMASGLPVIVTATGGTTDFCSADTAYLVPASTRKMDQKHIDDEPTLDHPTYAEPDSEALAVLMRQVYEHRREAGRLARAGMQKIRKEFTWDLAADLAAQRLTALAARPIRRD